MWRSFFCVPLFVCFARTKPSTSECDMHSMMPQPNQLLLLYDLIVCTKRFAIHLICAKILMTRLLYLLSWMPFALKRSSPIQRSNQKTKITCAVRPIVSRNNRLFMIIIRGVCVCACMCVCLAIDISTVVAMECHWWSLLHIYLFYYYYSAQWKIWKKKKKT